jgi:hypothetical protein
MNFSMTPEQIASLDALLKIIATPEAAKKRLDKLVEQTNKLKAAEKDFFGTQSIADIRTELASRENALNMRLAAADALEAGHKVQRDAIAAVLAS